MKVKIGKYKDVGERDLSIKIDEWDTYSMDHTLALIVHPMLVQLRDTTHSAPFIPFEDRPEHLIGTVPIRENGETDEFHHEAWDWVLTEMIHSFKSKIDDDWEEQFWSGEADWVVKECGGDNFSELTVTKGPNHTLKCDMEGRKKYQDRISNGFRLFGKYYENLWD